MSAEGPFKIDLPGSRLYGKITYVRTLTAADIRKISSAVRSNALLKIYDIFGSTLSGVDYRQLTMQDWNFLLVWQRINSYPYFPIEVKWECSHCGTQNITRITKDDFIIEPLDESYNHGIPVYFEDMNKTLHLRLSIVDDDMFAHEFLMKTRGISNPGIEEVEPVMMACMITNKDMVFAEKLDLVEKMTVNDYWKFKSFEEYYDYGVKEFLRLTCSKCSKVSEVSYRLRITEFFPQNFNREYLRNYLSAGLNSQPTDSTARGNGLFTSDMDDTKVQGDKQKVEPREESQREELVDLTKIQ